MTRPLARTKSAALTTAHDSGLVVGIRELLKAARRSIAHAVNAMVTARYWEIGRRIVDFEHGGAMSGRVAETNGNGMQDVGNPVSARDLHTTIPRVELAHVVKQVLGCGHTFH